MITSNSLVQGHNKPITVMTKNKNCDTVFTGSHDGFITSWDVATGESHRIGGVGHGNQMNGMVTLGESIFTCGIDNAIKEVSMMTKSFANTNVKLASQSTFSFCNPLPLFCFAKVAKLHQNVFAKMDFYMML